MTSHALLQSLVFGQAYFFFAALNFVGLYYVFPAARYLHGSDIHWEEIEPTQRTVMVLLLTAVSITPLVNMVAALYLVYYYATGYKKRHERWKVMHEKIMETGRQSFLSTEKGREFLIKHVEGGAAYVQQNYTPAEKPTTMSQAAGFEKFLKGVFQHIHQELCRKIGIAPHAKKEAALRALEKLQEAGIQELWLQLMAHYKRFDMRMFDHFSSREYSMGTINSLFKRMDHLAEVVHTGFFVVMPAEAYVNVTAKMKEIRANYPEIPE